MPYCFVFFSVGDLAMCAFPLMVEFLPNLNAFQVSIAAFEYQHVAVSIRL